MSDEPKPAPSESEKAGMSETSHRQGWLRPDEIKILVPITIIVSFLSAIASLVALRSVAILLWSVAIAAFIVAAVVTYVRSRRRPVQLPLLAMIAGVAVFILSIVGVIALARAPTHRTAAVTSPPASSRSSSSRPTPSHSTPGGTPSQSPCASAPPAGSASGIAAAGAPFATLLVPDRDAVYTVAFSPDGQMLAVGSLDATYPPGRQPVNLGGGLYLWDVACASVAAEHHITPVPDPGTKGVRRVVFSPDGKLLAAEDGNDTTYLWDVAGPTATLAASLPDPAQSDLAGVAFGPGNTLFTGDVSGSAYEWDIPAAGSAATGPLTPVASFPGQCGPALDIVALSPDGRTLALGCYNGVIDLWDISTHTLTTSLLDPHSQGVIALAFDGHDGSILASGDLNGQTYLWNVASRSLIGSLQAADVTQQVRMMAFNPAGTVLLTADNRGYIYAWNVATRTLLRALRVPDGAAVFYVTFSPSGAMFAAGDYGDEASVWYTSSLTASQ